MPERTSLPPFPFFLGCGRSGTTLLRLMFDSHPELSIPPESYFPIGDESRWLARDGRLDVDAIVNVLEGEKWLTYWRLDPGALRAAALAANPSDYADVIRTLYQLFADLQGKARYGNKTPKHVYSISALALLFPEARFVHVVRDGRDVALSYLDQPFGPSNIGWAARMWAYRVQLGRETGSPLGEHRYTEVRYEDVLEAPETELRRLCAFIELRFDDAMLRYHETRPDLLLRRDPDRHLLKPPTKGLRDWRSQMSRSDLFLFESIAGDALDAFGYPRSGIGPTGIDRLRVRVRAGASDTRRRLELLGRRSRTGRTADA